MRALFLHDFLAARGAVFDELNGQQIVRSFGPVEGEYLALTQGAALLDLSFRSRICVLGSDREKFIHGQVTNDVARLKVGQGCYGALINAKGRLQSDLFIYKLREELLLDFEPGLTQTVLDRLEKYVIAEEAQLVDVSEPYGLLSVQGPRAKEVLEASRLFEILPEAELSWVSKALPEGEVYVVQNARLKTSGYDLFVPSAALERTASALETAIKSAGGLWAGFEASEIVRIENGIPRFGVDMTESNLAPEAEIQTRAISYSKGCYIGQEVIARIRTYGQVAKALRLLRLPDELVRLPQSGTKLLRDGKEVGYLTSSTLSPRHGAKVALGYVRKEVNTPGETLKLADGEGLVQVIGIPGQP